MRRARADERLIGAVRPPPRRGPRTPSVRGLPDPRYGDEDWERVRDAAQVLVLAAAELDEVFREQGAVDFQAVSLAALRALGSEESPTDLGLRLDYRLRHLLLDEFQDTSGAQLELVRMLTSGWQRGDGRSVFCVGDPMQSIYGFRQAEVRAFLELAETGIGELTFDLRRLSSNFRSRPALVHWINGCFARIMPRTDDRQRGAIAFRPSESEVQVSDGDERAVILRGMPSPAAEANAVAELIEARRSQIPSGVSPSSCARARMPATSRSLCELEVSHSGPWISSLCRTAPWCAIWSC